MIESAVSASRYADDFMSSPSTSFATTLMRSRYSGDDALRYLALDF